MRAIIAELTVADVDEAAYWYRGLGFRVDLEGLQDEDGLQWASLDHGGRAVWLVRGDLSTYDLTHPPRTTLYLEVADVDALHQQLSGQSDVQVEGAPADKWYGQREFAVKDPNGYRWVLTQPIPPEQTPPPPGQPGR